MTLASPQTRTTYARPTARRHRLTIPVTSGVGQGPTEIAAFDGALREAGVHNFNLLCLSSVVPPGSKVEVIDGSPAAPIGDWGDRLYVVMANQRSSTPGEEVWAGVGWVQDPETGKGLFVEHEGTSEAQVRQDIAGSLDSLCAGRSQDTFGPQHSVVRGAVCEGEPVCALVVAVFESQGWGPVIDLS